ncbi:hypothetical protein MHH70_10750 [Metasolibacillus sp. FSL H7-0170]|uniref:hypothetical protein n=1 Tax=Metasolibacillus sp. FSL H7-0170 TaxID=2921431 RepID=UPI00315916E7
MDKKNKPSISYSPIYNYAMVWLTFIIFIFVSLQMPHLPTHMKTLIYGTIIVYLLLLINGGLEIFGNIPKRVNISINILQLILSIPILVFSVLKEELIFIFFSIFLILVFTTKIFLLMYKKAKD